KYIVKLKTPSNENSASSFGSHITGISLDARLNALRSKLSRFDKLKPINHEFLAVDFQDIEGIKDKIAELQNAGAIEYAEPDVKAYALTTPNDPLYTSQWAHQKIQSNLAFDITYGSQAIVVAMIDTGVDYSHPDLAPNMWVNPREVAGNGIDDDGNGYIDDIHGYDFANNDPNPAADDTGIWHGTHTAGTVGARGGNGTGISGHSPIVKIMALKFLNSQGGGDASDAIRAIDYAIQNGAKIMNNSWGSEAGSRALSEAVLRARNAGVLFVAASGNGGNDGVGDNNDTSPSYPANYQYDNVISVASTNSVDGLSGFSNYGATNVQVGAPGEGILSTMNGGRYQSMDGTSMAAPLVSGVLALLMARRPDLNYLAIKAALLNNVDRLPALQGKVSSGGRVNAYKALTAIATGENPNPPPPNQVPVINTPTGC
ncbi:MAG: S8 family peptidase, partial [Bdellovibrionia bacterium]